MAKLWFGNSFGKKRIIADCSSWAEVNTAIDKFIEEANARSIAANPKWNPFQRYYTRMWNEENQSVIDVGSHTEFFYWDHLLPTDGHGFIDEEAL